MLVHHTLAVEDIIVMEALMGCHSPRGANMTQVVCEIFVVDRAKQFLNKLMIIWLHLNSLISKVIRNYTIRLTSRSM